MVTTQQNTATLMRLLPAIYREVGADPLDDLLRALESILLDRRAVLHAEPQRTLSVGERITALPYLFNPVPIGDSASEAEGSTPREFLPWLARLVALKSEVIDLFLGDEASPAEERTFRNVLATIVPLYGRRGTRGFLEEALPLFIPEITRVEIEDRDLPGLRVGSAEIGKSSWLVTRRPFHFSMRIDFAVSDGDDERFQQRRKLRHRAETIIELSKPAHTTYDVHWEFRWNRR